MRSTTGSMIISILFILSRVMFIIDDFVPEETIVLKLFHILYFTITFSTGILSVLGILLYRPQWILPLAILMDSFSPDHDFKITYVFVFAIIYFVLFIAYFNDVDNNLRIGYYFIPHEYFKGGSNCESEKPKRNINSKCFSAFFHFAFNSNRLPNFHLVFHRSL
ncbi:hypothetical protein PRIPAC_81975 [Pristionchus pacificus]|uniref:Uncharacterized protein n=1 Tax=Pristionchus pacificus TaxID=54126 RepID=A0A2A6CCA9_PRIPA|nr:hypothetical protein PRIPAC_81975 [Pristionchus pacificus]|eukprot:PDM75651.1 hypothetical protein PRIPAC_42828 [Pristionchus pacificus]